MTKKKKSKSKSSARKGARVASGKNAKAKTAKRTVKAEAVAADVVQGGRRSNSGRPALFRGKSSSATSPMLGTSSPVPYKPTAESFKVLESRRARIGKDLGLDGISRSDYLEALVRVYVERVTPQMHRKTDETAKAAARSETQVTYLPTPEGLAKFDARREVLRQDGEPIARSRFLETLVREFGSALTANMVKIESNRAKRAADAATATA